MLPTPNRFHLWTTGKDFEKHIKMLDKNNIITLMEEYKKQYREDLVDAINGEWGLDKNIKNRVLNHIKKCLEDNYGYNRNFVNNNSQVSNKWHKGDNYSIVNKNDILTVKNTQTGLTRTIDLNKLTEDLDLRGQAAVKAQLTRLPGEILMDIAIEGIKLKPANWIDKLTMPDAAACYSPITNNITLGVSNAYDISEPLVHELGHAVDFKGKIINSSTASEYKEFMDIYIKERDAFIAKNGKQHDWNDKNVFGNTYIRKDGGRYASTSNYASENEVECFAEIYQLLTTGECQSADLLEDFFPETIRVAEKILNEIRNLPDNVRASLLV